MYFNVIMLLARGAYNATGSTEEVSATLIALPGEVAFKLHFERYLIFYPGEARIQVGRHSREREEKRHRKEPAGNIRPEATVVGGTWDGQSKGKTRRQKIRLERCTGIRL